MSDNEKPLQRKKKYRITIVDYNPEWPRQYEEEKARILAVAGDVIVAIEHVGSTAVPGLGAKPIIDIMIAVDGLDEVSDVIISALESIGYEHVPEPDFPERRFLRKFKLKSEDIRSHHVSITEKNSKFWTRHLFFRDYLREHPETARQYCRLKRYLAARHGTNHRGYTVAKSFFIEKVLARAREHS